MQPANSKLIKLSISGSPELEQLRVRCAASLSAPEIKIKKKTKPPGLERNSKGKSLGITEG